MAKITKTPNPFDSDVHSIVQLAAAFFFVMTVAYVISGPPESPSIGEGLRYTLSLISWSGASAVTACFGLAITTKAMRSTKGKRKTTPNKEVLWYFIGYLVVLTLPIALTIFTLRV